MLILFLILFNIQKNPTPLNQNTNSFPSHLQPIYATLSDIVIYSPKGATPAAIALAEKFREAIQKKRKERIEARRPGLRRSTTASESNVQVGMGMGESKSAPAQIEHTAQMDNQQEEKQAFGEEGGEARKEDEADDLETQLLQYNVFVLNATCEDMRKEMPHLMMRICGAGVPGGLVLNNGDGNGNGEGMCESPVEDEFGVGASVDAALGARMDASIGAHTDGPDGHLIEQWGEEQRDLDERREKELKRARGGGGLVWRLIWLVIWIWVVGRIRTRTRKKKTRVV
jgi:dual specificity MAP kinase phosphatase